MGEWLEKLQNDHPVLGRGTDQAVLQAVKDNLARFEFVQIQSEFEGHTARLSVFRDALKIDGVRVAVTAACAQQVADLLGCSLLTPRLCDLVWEQAREIAPRPRGLWLAGNTLEINRTRAMIEHSRAIDAQNPGAGLVADVGKDWCLSQSLVGKPQRACNYGWHTRRHPFAGIRTEASASLPDVRVIQGPGTAHNLHHVDYSQTLRLVQLQCQVDGHAASLLDIMRDPRLAGLLSHEGALTSTRLVQIPHADAAMGGAPELAALPTSEWRTTLELGMHGADVKAWRAQLQADGHDLLSTEDDVFDHFTDRETRLWQAARGLSVDGQVGAKSRNAIGHPAEPGVVPTLDATAPLGERALSWSLQETEAYRGKPPPDARLAFYLGGCQREVPQPDGPLKALELPASANFCAAAACVAARAVVTADEPIPHLYRASGIELQRDARTSGTWLAIEQVRLGTARPMPGDLIILTRAGAPWFRHVSRVLDYDETAKVLHCVDANASGRVWKRVTRPITHERLLGFISYPRATVGEDTSDLDVEIIDAVNNDISPDLNGPVTRVVDTAANVTTALGCLREADIDCVIRYYTKNETSFKLLRRQEAVAICEAGLKLMVVYQDAGTSAEHFNEALGVQAGEAAQRQASSVIGQPEGSAIYFAVDFDASETEVAQNIVPYFSGVKRALARQGSHYRVGVYGSGLVCQKVLDQSLAELAWLSNARAWRGSKSFEASDRWALRQQLPTMLCGLPFDPNDTNPDHPDVGAFRIDVSVAKPLFKVVAPAGLRVRRGPSTTADIVDVMPPGTEVQLGRREGGWVEVDRNQNGKIAGWSFAKFLQVVA